MYRLKNVWVLGLVWFCFSSALWANDAHITILYNNDLYGQLVPRGQAGGMAARVQKIRALREDGPTLVLDAGDVFGPQALSWFDEGATMAFALHRAGAAGIMPGNLDLTLGWEALLARQEEFDLPMVMSNLAQDGGAVRPFAKYLLVDVGSVKVGVVGVLDPAVTETIPPRYVVNVRFLDPLKTVNETAKTLRDLGADCVIALTHMEEGKTLALARKMEGIDLVVAGGYAGLENVRAVPGEMRLLNGLTVVTTPRYGVHLGRVDLYFSRMNDGFYRVSQVTSEQIPLNIAEGMDEAVAERITELQAEYDRAAKKPLGRIAAKGLDAQARLVAGIMRRHTHSEVGIINQGSLREISSGKPLTRGDVDELIRFDDRMVKMLLTGRQLKDIASQSQRSSRDASKLVMVGFQPKSGTVNRRPIRNDEVYRVAVTEFLADGGDGYSDFRSGTQTIHTGIALRGLIATMLQDTSIVIREDDLTGRDTRRIWRANWGIEGAFNRNYIDATTLAYRANNERVSFLSGETSVSWNADVQWALVRDSGQHIWRLENRMSFGQVGTTFGDLEKSEDQFDADLIYVYRARNFAAEPFGSIGYSTAITATDGQRPKLVRSSAGFQRRVRQAIMVRVGARAQRDLVADENDVGFELGLDMRRNLHGVGQLRSRVRSFFGVTDRRVISIENYNTLTFPLVGDLSLSARQNNFLYRVNKIKNVPTEGIAFRWDLTLGLVYGLDWKWY